MAIDWLAAFAADCRTELGWTPSIVDLGGGLGIPYTDEDPRLPVETFVRALLDRLEHAWSLHDLPPPRSSSSRVGRSWDRPGDPLSRRLGEAGERERDVRRGRRRHVRQPASAALRRAPHGAGRQPRGRAGGRRVLRLRQALRVGGRDDRARPAPRTAPRRHPRRRGDGRVHARHELELQRCPAARGGRARRGRRGSRHPQPRDGRRPPAAGAG